MSKGSQYQVGAESECISRFGNGRLGILIGNWRQPYSLKTYLNMAWLFFDFLGIHLIHYLSRNRPKMNYESHFV